MIEVTIKFTLEGDDRFSEESYCALLEKQWEDGDVDVQDLWVDSTSMETTFEVVDSA